MMPSAPSATDLHRGRVGHDREHDVGGGGRRARRGCKAHAGLDQRLGLVPAAVPARDRVAGRHQPWDDARAHGAEPDETDVHSFTSQRAAVGWISRSARAAMMTQEIGGRLGTRHGAAPGALLDHDLHPVAGADTVAGGEAVENAKALDLPVGHRHPARQFLDGVPGLDGHDLEVQRLRRLAFRQRHAAERADRFAEGAVDLRGRALRGKDEAIDVAAEPHRVEPKRPIGRPWRSRSPPAAH